MIETVLDLSKPLQSCEILETSFLGEDIDAEAGPEKAIRLDVRVRLPDGTDVDIEMQAREDTSFDTRLLYYWAKIYSASLRSGKNSYGRLRPVVVIAWLNAHMFATPHYHNIFEVRERASHRRLNEHLAIHILELPKTRNLDASPSAMPSRTERRLHLWSRFLLNEGQDELEQLAQEDPIMREAKETLEELSADPQTRLAAQTREMHLVAYYDALAAEREAGEAEGIAKGKADMLLKILDKRFGSLPTAVAERIQVASLTQLDGWIEDVLDISSLAELMKDH